MSQPTPSQPTQSQTPLATLFRLPNFLQLSLSVLMIGLAASITLPYFTLFAVNRGQMTPLMLGIFMTLQALSGIFISLRLAQWSDSLPNRKPVPIIAMFVSAVGYLSLRQMHSYFPMLLVVCLFLATGTASFSQLFALAKTQFQNTGKEASEHGITALRTIFSLAWVVGPGVGAALVGHDDYNRLFFAAAILLSLTALLVMGIRVVPANTTEQKIQIAGSTSSSIPLWQIMLAFVLYAASQSMGTQILPLFITKVLHGNTTEIGFLYGLGALLEIPVMLSLIFVPKRFGLQSMIVFAFGLTAVYFSMIWFSQSTVLLTIAQFPKAIVLAIVATQGMSYFQRLMPERIGTATALFSSTNSLGAIFAGVVSGGVAQFFGFRSVFLVCAMLTTLASLALYSAGRRAELKTEAATL